MPRVGMGGEIDSDLGLEPCRRKHPAAKADNQLRAFIDGKHRDAENADTNEPVKRESQPDQQLSFGNFFSPLIPFPV